MIEPQRSAINSFVASRATKLLQAIPEIGLDWKISAADLLNDPQATEDLSHSTDLWEDVQAYCARLDPNCFSEYVFQQPQWAFHEVVQRCLTDFPLLVMDAPIEHGKTTQVAVVRPLFEYGLNVAHMVVDISSTATIPMRCLRAIRETINYNSRFQRVFPHVRLEKETQDELYLERPRGLAAIHPSLKAVGIEGSIWGSRGSIIILDDILDARNTYTEMQRRKQWDTLNSTILDRRLVRGKVWSIGTPWFIDDTTHKMRKVPGFTHVHFDAEDGEHYRINGKQYAIPQGVHGSLWPDLVVDPETGHEFGWPTWRLKEKKDSTPAHVYMRKWRCVAMQGLLGIFKPEILEAAYLNGHDYYKDKPFRIEQWDNGRVRTMWRPTSSPKAPITTGVDLAITKNQTGDEVGMWTGCIVDGKREILEIRCGQMELGELLRHFLRCLRRYGAQHRGFRVENNAAQDYIVQALGNAEIMKALGASQDDLMRLNVRAHTTLAQNKNDENTGVRAMSLYFEQSKWPIPCDEHGRAMPLVDSWVEGMLAFDPASHTSDLLMASWLWSEEARSYDKPAYYVG